MTLGFRGILFDRDGVLNKLVSDSGRLRAPWSLRELELFDDSLGLIRWLKTHGVKVGIVTNQPDAARGRCNYSNIVRVHREVCTSLGVKWSHLCLHSDFECLCRKPAPGGVRALLKKMNEAPGECVLVGDRWTDIAAGQSAGVKTILVSQDMAVSYAPTSTGQSPDLDLKPSYITENLAGLKSLLIKL